MRLQPTLIKFIGTHPRALRPSFPLRKVDLWSSFSSRCECDLRHQLLSTCPDTMKKWRLAAYSLYPTIHAPHIPRYVLVRPSASHIACFISTMWVYKLAVSFPQALQPLVAPPGPVCKSIHGCKMYVQCDPKLLPTTLKNQQ